MTADDFVRLIANVTSAIAGKPVDTALETDLNQRFPANGTVVAEIAAACRTGSAAGWLCNREQGGIRFGRVAKPSPELHGYSIDVVDMNEVAGPHHTHPNGEVDLIMPTEGDARFDGRGAGWLVYPAGSSHRPTVSGGRAFVLYLLPGGAIEFTR
ncbi:MAG: DUF4863 family protein [Rhodocyclaceae bacterium]|jgi:hypothetical protein|nr:DUF4863 family protein [Rhodocyclaceae bacterium]MBK6552540.1 DUF4863 family protein [Rhodocyclaceae bacterium]MBK9312077.1 DUF4863 family protein [Rhodocyclaceae bacterium]